MITFCFCLTELGSTGGGGESIAWLGILSSPLYMGCVGVRGEGGGDLLADTQRRIRV